MEGQWGEMCKIKVNEKAGTGLRTQLKMTMVTTFGGIRDKVGGIYAFISLDMPTLLS